jgi:hypothetical protein
MATPSSRTTRVGLACAAVVGALLFASVGALGVELSSTSVSASLPSTSVSVTVPEVSLSAPTTSEPLSVSGTTAPTPSITTPSAAITESPSASPPSTVTASNESQTTASPSSGKGPGVAASPSAGYGSSGGSSKQGTGTSPALRRGSRRDRALARERALRATVERLQGCLGNLPSQLRLVLELRAGVNAPRALGRAAVAKDLRVSVREVPQLEKRALRRLRLTARSHSCARDTRAPSALLVFTDFGPALGGDGGAAGGVDAVGYTKSPSRERSAPTVKRASPSGDPLLGIKLPAAAGGAIPVIFIVLAGLLLLGFVYAADELGLGPRHAEWRDRWMHLPPRR